MIKKVGVDKKFVPLYIAAVSAMDSCGLGHIFLRNLGKEIQITIGTAGFRVKTPHLNYSFTTDDPANLQTLNTLVNEGRASIASNRSPIAFEQKLTNAINIINQRAAEMKAAREIPVAETAPDK